jgi:NitT/TauT family transport system substrate-binding protein
MLKPRNSHGKSVWQGLAHVTFTFVTLRALAIAPAAALAFARRASACFDFVSLRFIALSVRLFRAASSCHSDASVSFPVNDRSSFTRGFSMAFSRLLSGLSGACRSLFSHSLVRHPSVADSFSVRPAVRPAARFAAAFTLAGAALTTPLAHAEDHVTVLTNWYAQAEHGGFYQAAATGIYKKYGLDVTIKMGGPQVNGMQLLAAGQANFILGYDFQVLSSVEAGIPATTVAASFQYDPQGLMTHDDVKSLADLKNKTILVAGSGRTSWWPWLRAKYAYTEAQARPYTFNLQPFFVDPNVVQQAYPSSEPYQAQQAKVKTHFFLFADDGYPPYNTTIVTMQKTVKERPDVVSRFVKATMEGWKSYLADPAPGNALIKKDNPDMSDGQLAFGLDEIRRLKLVTGGDASTLGIGTMTDARWKKTDDYMVSEKLLKADTDYKAAYTLQFVKDTKVMP